MSTTHTTTCTRYADLTTGDRVQSGTFTVTVDHVELRHGHLLVKANDDNGSPCTLYADMDDTTEVAS